MILAVMRTTTDGARTALAGEEDLQNKRLMLRLSFAGHIVHYGCPTYASKKILLKHMVCLAYIS